MLNQPGRALARCVLWLMAALAFFLPPLGQGCLLVARVESLNYVFANLAGLFLSGLLSMALLVVILAVIMVAFPVLGSSKVPRPQPDVRKPRP